MLLRSLANDFNHRIAYDDFAQTNQTVVSSSPTSFFNATLRRNRFTF